MTTKKPDSNIVDLEDTGNEANPAIAQAPADVVADAVKVTASGAADLGFSGKKVRITIHDGKEDIDRLPVNVGINGYAYQINRNAVVEVPEEVLLVLENAVEERYEFNKEGGVRALQVKRFAYTVHGPAV
jgi:hypothetical protein